MPAVTATMEPGATQTSVEAPAMKSPMETTMKVVTLKEPKPEPHGNAVGVVTVWLLAILPVVRVVAVNVRIVLRLNRSGCRVGGDECRSRWLLCTS